MSNFQSVTPIRGFFREELFRGFCGGLLGCLAGGLVSLGFGFEKTSDVVALFGIGGCGGFVVGVSAAQLPTRFPSGPKPSIGRLDVG